MSITALIGSGLKFHALSKRTHRTAPQPLCTRAETYLHTTLQHVCSRSPLSPKKRQPIQSYKTYTQILFYLCVHIGVRMKEIADKPA